MQTQIITKYCYLFEKENVTTEHIVGVFGGVNEIFDTPEKAESELKWDQNEDEHWFKRMIREKGQPYIAAIDFIDGQVVSLKKL
jgi:predicted RNA-binding protein with EMAP domain